MTEQAKEARRAYRRQWAKANPEKVKASQKKWRDKNADHISEYYKNWNKDHPGKAQQYNEKYWERVAASEQLAADPS